MDPPIENRESKGCVHDRQSPDKEIAVGGEAFD